MTATVTPINEPQSKKAYALHYAALGWHVLPLWWWDEENKRCGCGDPDCGVKNENNPGKHPHRLVRNGQLDASTDPSRIEYWWGVEPRANIGVFLSKSGLCAIDIDPRNGGLETIEDIEATNGPLVSGLLQFTGGGGEHRVFLRPEGALPGKLGAGVDVKLNGYIVLEPSNHKSGGAYQWEASSSPFEGALPSALPDWMRDMVGAVAAQFRTLDGPVGLRTITDKQADELRDALRFIDANDYHTWVRVGLALKGLGAVGFEIWDQYSQSSDKYRSERQISTWRSFQPSAINYETVFQMAQESGWPNPMSAAFAAPALPEPVPVETIALPAPATHETQAPEFRLPGVLGVVQDWVDAKARKPQPAFAIQTALAFAATVLGRRYVTCQRNWPSLYFLNIGKSASGKEHAKWALEHLLEACSLPHLIGPGGYTSDSGLLSALHRQPSHLGIIDEFGKVLEAASIKGAARPQSTMRMLMEVWARADGAVRPQGYSTFGLSATEAQRSEQRTIRNPALSLMTMTTPDSFFETIGSGAARDGFLNRFLIVESDIGRQVGRRVAQADVPGMVVDWVQASRDAAKVITEAADLAATPITIPFTAQALQMVDEYSAECIALMDEYDQAGLAEMFGRCAEVAMRVSLLVAVGCRSASIEAQHFAWARQYVAHHALRTVNQLRDSVADSEFQAAKLQVLACIRRAGARGMTERDLGKASRKFAAMDQRGQVNVLNSLAFTGDVARVNVSPLSGKGKPRAAYVVTIGDEDVPD